MNTPSATGESALNCMYWGFVLATILLGVTIIQGFIYFKHYDDKKPLQLLVIVLIALDFVTSALMAHATFYYLIENYGDPASLIRSPPLSFTVEYLTTALVAFLCQMFYASQIFKLRRHSRHCVVPFVAMILLSTISLLSNTIATSLILAISYFNARVSSAILKVFTSIGNCFAVGSDIIACVALCLFLASYRADIGRGHTTLIDRLLFFTINRGILFSVAQLGHMIAYISASDRLYWLPFHLCVSKLHVNSLLALLNSRRALRGAAQEVSKITFHVDQTPAPALAPGKTRSQLMMPIELNGLQDSRSTSEDKFEPSPSNVTMPARRWA